MHIFKVIFENLKMDRGGGRNLLALSPFKDPLLKKHFRKMTKTKKETFKFILSGIHSDFREVARVDGMARLLDMWLIVGSDDRVNIVSKNLIHFFNGDKIKSSFPIKELRVIKLIKNKCPFIKYSGPGSDLRYASVLLDMAKESSLLICMGTNEVY